MLRPFTITDLGLWNRVSSQAVFLNSESLFTQGSAAITRTALLSPLSSLTGIHTYLNQATGDGLPSIGQVAKRSVSNLAYCRFFAPENALRSNSFGAVLDGLLERVGALGAHSLIAEVDEDHPAYIALRQNGFSIYARQQIWMIGKMPDIDAQTGSWRPVLQRDALNIELLQNSLIPGQVQQIEGSKVSSDGYVLYREGQLLAYAKVKRGPCGIWLQPFVSLDAAPFENALAELLIRLRPRTGRPIYVCLRSYQDWLRTPLQKLGAEPGPQQAVFAKRITLPLKVEEARRIPVTNRSAEPTTPIHAPLPRAREPEWIRYDQTPNYR